MTYGMMNTMIIVDAVNKLQTSPWFGHQADFSQPPSGPYPVEKKERKKAQNRTAAFRYREKKKSEQDMIDEELELLSTKNNVLKDKLTEMETEFKYLKKLMTEAGLGRYAQTVKI